MLQFISKDFNDDSKQQQAKQMNRSDDLPGNANNAAESQAVESESQQEQDYLTVDSCDNKIKRGTIALAILFTMGLLCVLFMIKKSSPSVAVGQRTSDELQIESAITQLTGLKLGRGSQIEQIVRRFNQFSDVKKLQIEQLQKNPFVREKYLPTIVLGSEDDSGALARQAESMQLLSIMNSNEGNCCMIDDKILYEGDRIGGFEVCQISDYSVELCADGMRFVLRISPDF